MIFAAEKAISGMNANSRKISIALLGDDDPPSSNDHTVPTSDNKD